MTKLYVLDGCECHDNHVYATRALAEKAAETENLALMYSGSWNRVSVKEMELITNEEDL
jgi:hypothetical protein